MDHERTDSGSARTDLIPERLTQWREALAVADAFLKRWRDRVTRTEWEDIRVESAVRAVLGSHRLEDRGRFPAFVRTITRRCRADAVREFMRGVEAGCQYQGDCNELAERSLDGGTYAVGDRWIPRHELLAALPRVFAHIEAFSVKLLLAYYEGFSCVELAERYGVTLDVVKVRIHRARRRVKGLLEIAAERATRTDSGEWQVGTVPSCPHRWKKKAKSRKPRSAS